MLAYKLSIGGIGVKEDVKVAKRLLNKIYIMALMKKIVGYTIGTVVCVFLLDKLTAAFVALYGVYKTGKLISRYIDEYRILANTTIAELNIDYEISDPYNEDEPKEEHEFVHTKSYSELVEQLNNLMSSSELTSQEKIVILKNILHGLHEEQKTTGEYNNDMGTPIKDIK